MSINSLTTNKLNQILHQSGRLSSKYLIQRTNEKYDEPNAHKYKIIIADYMIHLNQITKIN